MNKIWNDLLSFETRDLINNFYQKKHKRAITERKAIQVASNFMQARDYFTSLETANFTVKPLLQYYGILSLSKGLILLLSRDLTEDQLKASHGLEIRNWKKTISDKLFEEIEITVCDGTFLELIESTRNKNYLHANSSVINYISYLSKPNIGDTFILKDVINYFPDLSKEYQAWINKELAFYVIDSLTINKTNNRVSVKVSRNPKIEYIDLIFPEQYCKNRKVEDNGSSLLIEYDLNNWHPNITQLWHSAFNIGDAAAINVLKNDIGLNLLSAMFMISYTFGMLSRYYPSVWIGLRKVSKGDKIFPFAWHVLDFIYEYFPIQVYDFLCSPYPFEAKKES